MYILLGRQLAFPLLHYYIVYTSSSSSTSLSSSYIRFALLAPPNPVRTSRVDRVSKHFSSGQSKHFSFSSGHSNRPPPSPSPSHSIPFPSHQYLPTYLPTSYPIIHHPPLPTQPETHLKSPPSLLPPSATTPPHPAVPEPTRRGTCAAETGRHGRPAWPLSLSIAQARRCGIVGRWG